MDRHRQNNFWEPTYSPTEEPLTQEVSWNDLQDNNGPRNKICRGEDLPNTLEQIIEKDFRNCDFVGKFTNGRQIVFTQCNFTNCHFGKSQWEKIKFSKCRFQDCSFGVSRFRFVQFIDCEYERNYFSGNETQFEKCIIDPKKFIKAGWTNLDRDVLATKQTSPGYQKRRFELTKAKAAKAILNSLRPLNDDVLFYSAIKVSVLQAVKASLSKAWHLTLTKSRLRKIPHVFETCFYAIELASVYIYGQCAGWGASVMRPLCLGAVATAIFGTIYCFGLELPLFSAIRRSIDILLLAGYTKYPIEGEPKWAEAVGFINMATGVFWYSIIFPVILNRTVFQRN